MFQEFLSCLLRMQCILMIVCTFLCFIIVWCWIWVNSFIITSLALRHLYGYIVLILIITPIDGLVWKRHNSSMLATELCLSCTNPSTYNMVRAFTNYLLNWSETNTYIFMIFIHSSIFAWNDKKNARNYPSYISIVLCYFHDETGVSRPRVLIYSSYDSFLWVSPNNKAVFHCRKVKPIPFLKYVAIID